MEINDNREKLEVLVENECTIDRLRGECHSPQSGYYVAVSELGIILSNPLKKADFERGVNWLSRLDEKAVYIQSRHHEDHISLQVVLYFDQRYQAEACTIAQQLSVFRRWDGGLVSIND